MLKIETYDNKIEQRCLIAMINSDKVAAAVAPYCGNGKAFPSRSGDILAHLIAKFYAEFSRAPKGDMLAVFYEWSGTKEAQGDKETIDGVETVMMAAMNRLQQVEQQDELDNDDHSISQTTTLINRTAARKLIEDVETHVSNGEVSKALDKIKQFHPCEPKQGKFKPILRNAESVRRVFERSGKDPLITYPGDLGRFFGRALSPGNFVAVQAVEKRGKSTWLIDMLWKALRKRRRTLFYAAGDMSEDQMMQRFIVRACQRPMFRGVYKYPTAMKSGSDGNEPSVTYEDKNNDEPPTLSEALERLKDLDNDYIMDDDPYLEMAEEPTGTLTTSAIREECKRRAAEGRKPEIIIVDYADIMAAPAFCKDNRDKTHAIWEGLRGISLEFDLLMLTATQANAEAIRRRSQDMRNFSEDKRKNAHATGIFAINQDDGEKSKGLQRLNWLVLRDADYDSAQHVWVAGCMAVCNPAVRSCL